MSASRIAFGGIANWCNRGLNILLGLVLLPVLFRQFPPETLGIWLLLGQSAAILGLFDLGFGTIVTRRIAFAVAKGRAGSDRGHMGELADLIATARALYHWLSFCAFICSFLAGAIYLAKLHPHEIPVASVWTAWALICLGQAVSLWATPWTCILQGLGYVGWDSILAAVANSLTLVLQLVVAVLGGSLVSLALASVSGMLLQRLLIARFVACHDSELTRYRGSARLELCREMAGPALRVCITTLGFLMVGNTDSLFIAAGQGTAAIPAYRAAYLLVINLHMLAGVFSGASPVFVSQLWQAGNLEGIRVILRRNAQLGLWAMACGSAVILGLGPTLFTCWLGPGHFIGYPVLTVFVIGFLLEHHANVFSSCSRATNDEAFAASSIATGILKLALAWVLINPLGLLGLALSTLLSQTAINNWFMVDRARKRLRLNFAQHAREVLLPGGLLFGVVWVAAAVLARLLRNQSQLLCVSVVTAIAGLLLAAALWRLALTSSERFKLQQKLELLLRISRASLPRRSG